MTSSVLHITAFLILGFFSSAKCEKPVADFYWRDYTGIIPDDALPGGLDANNKTTYIGQGFLKDVGVIPGIIYEGQKHLMVAFGGVRRVDDYIKILCSKTQDAFKWLPVKTTNYFLATINKYLIRGGFENFYSLYIGRVPFQNRLLVGKVVTGPPERQGKAPMFFVFNDAEILAEEYEVLMYENAIPMDPPQQ